jgi:hypothetical protein
MCFRPILIIEIVQNALRNADTSVETLEVWLKKFGYVFYRIGYTGEHISVPTLKDCDGENILAFPQERTL